MTNFAVQEALIKTMEAAVGAFGLKSLPGSDGSAEVMEDVTEMCKGYKVGTPLQFTATFKATLDPEKQRVAETSEEADAIDVEVMQEE